jgi:hypothetical protein
VRVRAAGRCEYYRLPQEFDVLPFQIDHVIARQHDGSSTADNLALSCLSCNAHKGRNLAGIDPHDGTLVELFHPRKHKWPQHFRWDGPRLGALTSIGRVTIAVLQINRSDRVEHRRLLIASGGSFE